MEVKQNENIQKNIIVGKLNIEKKYIYSFSENDNDIGPVTYGI